MIVSLVVMAFLGAGWWAADRWLSLRSITVKVGDGEWSPAETGWAMLSSEIWPIFLTAGLLSAGLAVVGLAWVMGWLAHEMVHNEYQEQLKWLRDEKRSLNYREAKLVTLENEAKDRIEKAQAAVDAAHKQADEKVKAEHEVVQNLMKAAETEAADAAAAEKFQAELDVEDAQRDRAKALRLVAKANKAKMNAVGKAERHRRNVARLKLKTLDLERELEEIRMCEEITSGYL